MIDLAFFANGIFSAQHRQIPLQVSLHQHLFRTFGFPSVEKQHVYREPVDEARQGDGFKHDVDRRIQNALVFGEHDFFFKELVALGVAGNLNRGQFLIADRPAIEGGQHEPCAACRAGEGEQALADDAQPREAAMPEPRISSILQQFIVGSAVSGGELFQSGPYRMR
jgi:hypothetical protein